jgi:hypothetical protein
MKKISLVAAVLCLFGLLSCKGEQESQKKESKESLTQKTEKIGQDAAKAMKSPLDQARKAVEQENNHGQKVEKEADKAAN